MKEAVFGLRLKCRTRVPLQERRPTERRHRDFLPLGKHVTRAKIIYIYIQYSYYIHNTIENTKYYIF